MLSGNKMSNLNKLFKKKKQNLSRTSSYSRASSSASASRPSSASALRPSSASASRPSLFPRPLLESEDSDLTSSSVDQMNDEDMKEEIKTIKEEVAILSHDQACIDMSNLNKLFKKKKQNLSRTSSYSRASSSASASRPSSASALRPSSASASRPSLFPRPLLESEDSDLTSSSVDQMNDEDMKEEIKTIKEEVAILSHDQACIDAVIIKSAQDLLEKKIYPNYDEFKESAKFFPRESDNEFFFTLDSKWEPYFEKKIRKPLSKRLRSLRSTLCARVKTAIFENFSNMLPPISNVAKASEIAA
ncbi:hypothetical protein Glove_206g7 [Diversispora epigaea]|uniref:Uncharacterized protein n=1 Tax=Diversispora epigaea TaxID=1348612 RepID=A0A397ITW6_9GLOM|nr:hypothetical protein Glove_206g7 [Diversispora epigaea]